MAKTDFGKSMRESCPGKSVEVKSFDARIHNGKYTVAAVVRIDGKENLLVSSSKKVDEPCWKNITFDLRETLRKKYVQYICHCMRRNRY